MVTTENDIIGQYYQKQWNTCINAKCPLWRGFKFHYHKYIILVFTHLRSMLLNRPHMDSHLRYVEPVLQKYIQKWIDSSVNKNLITAFKIQSNPNIAPPSPSAHEHKFPTIQYSILPPALIHCHKLQWTVALYHGLTVFSYSYDTLYTPQLPGVYFFHKWLNHILFLHSFSSHVNTMHLPAKPHASVNPVAKAYLQLSITS